MSETVTDSQIINWLEMYQQKGFVFDIIHISGLKRFLRKYRLFRKTKADVETRLTGKVHNFFSIKASTLPGQILALTCFLVLLARPMILKRRILFQTRSSEYFFVFSALKKFYPDLFVIFDSRGAIAEEFLLTQGCSGMSGNQIEQPAIKKKYSRLLKRELALIEVSDLTFCVSSKLSRYYLDRLQTDLAHKIRVTPGCADSKAFYFDSQLRNRLRKKLGIERKFVFIYSGGLQQAWQIPDFIFRFFKEISQVFPEALLLCLTPHQDSVRTFKKQYLLQDDQVLSFYVRYDELNAYLCASDMGLLFRDNSLTNQVASPTKFAEYIMSGLPVIISRYVGDFSDFVRDQNLGVVIDTETISIDSVKASACSYPFNRHTISRIGRDAFSKQAYCDRITHDFSNLLKM